MNSEDFVEAARLIARSASALITAMGYYTENQHRMLVDGQISYAESAFHNLLDEFDLDYDPVVTKNLSKDHAYAYKVEWSEEDQKYVGTCLQFPSLSYSSPSEHEARIGIMTLVAESVKDIKNGD